MAYVRKGVALYPAQICLVAHLAQSQQKQQVAFVKRWLLHIPFAMLNSQVEASTRVRRAVGSKNRRHIEPLGRCSQRVRTLLSRFVKSVPFELRLQNTMIRLTRGYIKRRTDCTSWSFFQGQVNVVTELAAFAPLQQPILASVSINGWNSELVNLTHLEANHETARKEPFRATV